MKYKMVIFDLDGTILDTIQDLCEAVNYALAKYSLPLINIAICKNNIGHGIKHLVYESSNHFEKIDELLHLFKEYYSNHYNVYTRPYEGIDDVLNYCLNKNIKIGVLTNKVEDIARRLCDVHFKDKFSFVYGDIDGRLRKPNPTFLLNLIAELGYKKEEVLYIGDSEVDINTCINANIDGLFLSYGFRPKNDLLKLTSNVIDNPHDIIKNLE